jgi:hypothetical protein
VDILLRLLSLTNVFVFGERVYRSQKSASKIMEDDEEKRVGMQVVREEL